MSYRLPISWTRIKKWKIKIGNALPQTKNIDYGQNLRDFFLIFFSLSAAIVIARFFSTQKTNPLLYFQYQLHGRVKEGSIILSFIANLSSVIVFAFSIIIALWFASWIKKRCSNNFWIVVFKDIPITILVSFAPYCSFWIGTCILSGVDAHFLKLVNEVAPAFAWWNSSYLFLYSQVILTFLIFYCLSPKKSLVALGYFFLLVVIHSCVFYVSSQLWPLSVLYYALFNLAILLVYFLILVMPKWNIYQRNQESNNWERDID